ncbi:MAG: Gfo/Idh/MocA family oxidoreductase [Candidatus Omnitrophica bacterium]|nr:Gfo/Idh/MocA family oxidoreductase [Candidatus Omnitrophota bacterium]
MIDRMKKLKIVIFGLGSIGQRHVEILRKHFKHELYAFRSGGACGNVFGIPELTTWYMVDQIKPQVAFITNPTSEHLHVALECARRGMNLFIEKPLSDSLTGIQALITLCDKNKLTAYVAYCLRFHPVIEKIKSLLKGQKVVHARVVCSSMLHQWRAGKDSRKSYSAYRAMGGGVILDLSHEFDYIRFLLGEIKSIAGVKGRMGQVTVDSEDFADVLVTLENGIVVNCHLNFASWDTERVIQIDLKDGFIKGDLIQNTVVYQKNNKLRQFKFPVDRNHYLKKQTQYFFKNLNHPALMNNLKQAQVLLKPILEFRNGRG